MNVHTLSSLWSWWRGPEVFQARMLLSLPLQQLRALQEEIVSAYFGDGLLPVSPNESRARLVCEAMVDRSFSLAMNAFTGAPDRSTIQAMLQELDDAGDLFARRGWIEDPKSYHAEPKPVQDWQIEQESCRPGARLQSYSHLQYPSEYHPDDEELGQERWLDYEENKMFHAYILKHSGSEPRPWLICVHGFGMGSPSVNFFTFNARRLHEELGYNLLFPCLPLHGLRGRGWVSGGDLLAPDYINLIHCVAQAVWDLRRCIRWLRSQGEHKMAMYGLSFGAYSSALAAALEPEIACVIVGMPVVDFPAVAQNNEPWFLRYYGSEFQVDWKRVEKLTRVISPTAFDAPAERDRRFIFAGAGDRVVRSPQVLDLWHHWQKPEIYWHGGGHVAGQWNRGIATFIEDALRSTL